MAESRDLAPTTVSGPPEDPDRQSDEQTGLSPVRAQTPTADLSVVATIPDSSVMVTPDAPGVALVVDPEAGSPKRTLTLSARSSTQTTPKCEVRLHKMVITDQKATVKVTPEGVMNPNLLDVSGLSLSGEVPMDLTKSPGTTDNIPDPPTVEDNGTCLPGKLPTEPGPSSAQPTSWCELVDSGEVDFKDSVKEARTRTREIGRAHV
jgi:hypothetical protein